MLFLNQERASSVVSSILAKYDIRNRLTTTPVVNHQTNSATRSISTLFTRRNELEVVQTQSSSAPLILSTASTITSVVPPALNT